jgi:hypothetical protein
LVNDQFIGQTAYVNFDYRSSLVRRLRAMHSLYDQAYSSMTIEHVNHVERDGVLPIAFSLVHQVLIEDGSLAFVGGPSPQFNNDWAAKMGLAIPDHGKARTVEEMTHQRIGNYGEFQIFQRLVFDATEQYVATIDPDTFADIVVPYPYGPGIDHTFSARVGGDGGISRSDALECWVYQHGLRHMGEIEHARALVGLGGMTS